MDNGVKNDDDASNNNPNRNEINIDDVNVKVQMNNGVHKMVLDTNVTDTTDMSDGNMTNGSSSNSSNGSNVSPTMMSGHGHGTSPANKLLKMTRN